MIPRLHWREVQMRDFQVNINGIEVNAAYTEDNINHIFIPLLRRLTRMQRELGKRILVMLAAPPGTGKSTLCEYLKVLSEHTEGVKPIQVIGMDGFHRYQEYLTTHTTMREGKEILLVQIKGAPVTFDSDLLQERVMQVAQGENVGWPVYNRMTHNPTENAITVTGDIVILEGNYLLLEEEGWKNLKQYADYTIRITADENHLRERLIERKEKSGATHEEAVAFVEYSDLYNARICLEHTMKADMNLKLNADNSYSLETDRAACSSEPDIPDCGCLYG